MPFSISRAPLRTLALAAASCLTAGAAQAGPGNLGPTGVYTDYFVVGRVGSGAPGGGSGGGYQCNALGAFGNLGGCSAQPDGVRPAVTQQLSGTVDATDRGRAFTMSAQNNGIGTELRGDVYVNVPTEEFSRAQAAASLADGTLRASVINNASSGGYVAGSAYAKMHDIVTFTVADAAADTRTRVNFQFSVDGQVSDNGQTTIYGERGSGNAGVGLWLDIVSSFGRGSPSHELIATAGWAAYRADPVVEAPGVQTAPLAGGSWVQMGTDHMLFQGWFDIVGASLTLNPMFQLDTSCAIGLQCDYGHTAQFSLVGLPGSVTYTSASGVFLTSAVPEPATPLLWALGLGGLGLLASRRRSA
jgi:MYXO-CTERM domain-containing protein